MPSAGGARSVAEGREEAAEVRESVRVVRSAGRIGGAAMLGTSKLFDVWRFNVEDRIFGMAIFPGLAPRYP